jgi:hypothetical protein
MDGCVKLRDTSVADVPLPITGSVPHLGICMQKTGVQMAGNCRLMVVRVFQSDLWLLLQLLLELIVETRMIC